MILQSINAHIFFPNVEDLTESYKLLQYNKTKFKTCIVVQEYDLG